MTDKQLRDETAAIRAEISALKTRVQNVKDTYREIELIARELRRHVA